MKTAIEEAYIISPFSKSNVLGTSGCNTESGIYTHVKVAENKGIGLTDLAALILGTYRIAQFKLEEHLHVQLHTHRTSTEIFDTCL